VRIWNLFPPLNDAVFAWTAGPIGGWGTPGLAVEEWRNLRPDGERVVDPGCPSGHYVLGIVRDRRKEEVKVEGRRRGEGEEVV
jgi:hypothetical protein